MRIIVFLILLASMFSVKAWDMQEPESVEELMHLSQSQEGSHYLKAPLVPASEVPVPPFSEAPPRIEENVSDRSGAGRIISGVRLTYYTDRGYTRAGPWVFPGAAAVDTSVIPHGTLFRIVGDSVIRVAIDTGGLVRGLHTDIWVPDREAGQGLLERFGTEVEVEIIQEP